MNFSSPSNPPVEPNIHSATVQIQPCVIPPATFFSASPLIQPLLNSLFVRQNNVKQTKKGTIVSRAVPCAVVYYEGMHFLLVGVNLAFTKCANAQR